LTAIPEKAFESIDPSPVMLEKVGGGVLVESAGFVLRDPEADQSFYSGL
jgi:hypothetical protein